MTAELSHFSVLVALLLAGAASIVPLVGASMRWTPWMRFAAPAAILQFALVAIAFGGLTHAFVTSDFSVRLVADNSHSMKPMLYKVTGVWGNHEGSMLLWVLILVSYGALVARFGNNLPLAFKARVLSVQSMISTAFLAFLVFTSNPFARTALPPIDGNDLNPLLQDPGLAFHPPFLYVGYVGLSLTFSFAVAALIEGRVDAAWARWVRPWTLVAWTSLTIGIAMGSWWAYYELGWGGWWFWDPVENASFIPWLVATALLHSAVVVEKRDALKSWTVLLAILAFAFSLTGTFIVRSGVLTSVHAFANDPQRGVFILAIFAAATGGSLLLYAMRARGLGTDSVFAVASREAGLVVNNLLLSVAAFVVLFGTLWPLVAEFVWGKKLSVGAPFFDLAFTPFFVLLAVVLPVAAALPWKRGSVGRSLYMFRGVLALAFAAGVLAWSLQSGGRMLAPFGAMLATWLVFGAGWEVLARLRRRRRGFRATVAGLRSLPRGDWGKALAHAGLGIAIFGISAITAWEQEDIRAMSPGGQYSLSGYDFRLLNVNAVAGANYSSDMGTVLASRNGQPVAVLHPERRIYFVQGMQTTEAAIDVGLTRDLYVVLGDRQDDGEWVVRTYVKPFASWIWLGAAVMAFGGIVSLSDRRYRLGIANRRRARQVTGVEAG